MVFCCFHFHPLYIITFAIRRRVCAETKPKPLTNTINAAILLFRAFERYSLSGLYTGQGEESVSKGTVKWFSSRKGFGFIVPDGESEELFAHRSEIKMDGYATLDEGQRVEFEIEQGEKGPHVTHVIPIPS